MSEEWVVGPAPIAPGMSRPKNVTDRVQRLHVTLEQEHRTDDVDGIAHAIRMVKGVASVELAEPMDAADYVARSTVFSELFSVLIDLMTEARSRSDLYKQVRALLRAGRQSAEP